MAVAIRSKNLTFYTVINLLAGIWMIIAPFAVGAATGARWNDVIFGILILACAIGRMANPSAQGLSWANFIFGIWLIISPFILGFVGSGLRWNNIVTGIIVLIFAYLATRETGVTVGAYRDTGDIGRRAA